MFQQTPPQPDLQVQIGVWLPYVATFLSVALPLFFQMRNKGAEAKKVEVSADVEISTEARAIADALRADLAIQAAKYDKLDTRMIALREDMLGMREENLRLTNRIGDLEAANETLKKTLYDKDCEIAKLKVEATDLKTEVDTLRERIKELENGNEKGIVK